MWLNWYGSLPEAMLVSEGYSAAIAMMTRVTCAATWGHDNIILLVSEGFATTWGSDVLCAGVRICVHVCPWLLLPVGAQQMPRVWTATLDHIGVPVSCCHLGHTDLGGLCCHRAHVDIWPKILLRAYLGPCSCCSWGLWWCPWPILPQGVIGTRPVEIQGLCWAGLTPHWSWDSWPWTCRTLQQKSWPSSPVGMLLSLPHICSQERWPYPLPWPWGMGELAQTAWV